MSYRLAKEVQQAGVLYFEEGGVRISFYLGAATSNRSSCIPVLISLYRAAIAIPVVLLLTRRARAARRGQMLVLRSSTTALFGLTTVTFVALSPCSPLLYMDKVPSFLMVCAVSLSLSLSLSLYPGGSFSCSEVRGESG
ncbi:hypothetical protein GGR53DRAFT_243543 [Hypoxylon sp. FL1150]|nr:hypothetical protein GGR53DRAFT_243543 [Hypoxylon sp. FL1150]